MSKIGGKNQKGFSKYSFIDVESGFLKGLGSLQKIFFLVLFDGENKIWILVERERE